MGRSPCCDKVGLKKGPWTPEEDHKLLAYVDLHGHGNWRALPTKAGLQRCGKSCRLRWTNYLRPDIVRGKFSLQEEQTIIQLHALLGNRWSAIATHLPKRTDNEIKNYWNTHLKKRLTKMGIDPVTHKPKNDALVSNVDDAQSKSAANLSHMAQWESARLEAEARLARQSKLIINPTQTQLDSINLPQELYTSVNNYNNNNIPPPHQPTSSTSINNLGSTSSSPPPTTTTTTTTTRNLNHVLRAWQHGAHHSPTSTLSFSENGSSSVAIVGPTTTTNGEGSTTTTNAMIEFLGNKKINSSSDDQLIKGDGYDDEDGVGMTSLMPSFTSALHDDHHQGNFIEGFTELLLCNFSERNLNLSEEEAGDGGGGNGVTEDNKSYWNSILNLVNSSPSSSPLF